MMSSKPVTPSNEANATNQSVRTRPRTMDSGPNSYVFPGGAGGAPVSEQGHGPDMDSAPLSQSLNKHEDTSGLSRQDDASVHDGQHSMTSGGLRRSDSQMSQSQTLLPSRGGTLKKKASLKKTGSLKRSSSRRSSRAGSVRSLALGEKEKYGEGEEFNAAFYTPVPTAGSPTDILADRFQAWRKVLKDLITYFRDVQKSYDVRSKTLVTASNVVNNITIPPEFLASGGIADATYILRDFHKQASNESNKAKEIETEVIMQLTGLRSDLQQKIKEIKGLSGDFKNSVEKEIEGSRKAVRHLQEALGLVEADPAATAGKGDPFIVKLGVERQVERQIEEENYLHRAYLNLESSGRELESIVVGEIQKAYTAYAAILKREADQAFETAERLREGPLMMAKDHEWDAFVSRNDHMVDPKIPVRSFEHITFPGKDHPAAAEVRSGMLERKSKYLKNYTPGWYVLSPTHLHEFNSADRIASQAPIMSLYLPEQKLGSHSEPGSSSHKFMLKGRQTGGMHRGHAWVFRAESYDTMMAWFTDIKELTEKSGKERDAFVRRSHARSFSGSSMKAHSIGGSSDGGLEEDEADAQPYSSEQSVRGISAAEMARGQDMGDQPEDHAQRGDATYRYRDENLDTAGWRPSQRPSPGGRFPSDLNVHRGLQAPLSRSSGESSTEGDRDAIAAAEALPGSGMPYTQSGATQQLPAAAQTSTFQDGNSAARSGEHDYHGQPSESHGYAEPQQHGQPRQYSQPQKESRFPPPQSTEDSNFEQSQGKRIAPAAAAGLGSVTADAAAMHHDNSPEERQHVEAVPKEMVQPQTGPAQGTSSAPIVRDGSTTVSRTASTEPNMPAAPSSQGDTGSLPTVPTGIGSVNNGTDSSQKTQAHFLPGTGPETTSAAGADDSGSAATKPVPLQTTKSGTISNLHVPGEYPKTPKYGQ